jgi:hypothetical protein
MPDLSEVPPSKLDGPDLQVISIKEINARTEIKRIVFI